MEKKRRITSKQKVDPYFNAFDQTLADLQQIYQQAFDKGDLAVAIKAKELISKIYGFLDRKKVVQPFDISKISDQELEKIIEQLRNELGD